MLFSKKKTIDNVDNTSKYVKLDQSKISDYIVDTINDKLKILGISVEYSFDMTLDSKKVKEINYDREDIVSAGDLDDNYGYMKDIINKNSALDMVTKSILINALDEQKLKFDICLYYLEKIKSKGHAVVIAWN